MMTPAQYEAEIDRLSSALACVTASAERMSDRVAQLQPLIDEARYLLDSATNLLDKEEVDDRWELQSDICKFFAATD
jgi:hypothetical protein